MSHRGLCPYCNTPIWMGQPTYFFWNDSYHLECGLWAEDYCIQMEQESNYQDEIRRWEEQWQLEYGD